MRRLAAVLLISCATHEVRYAESFMLPDDHLEKPRALSITEASDDDAESFAGYLRARGFDVVLPVRGALIEKTRYGATITGFCSTPFSSGTLRIDVFDMTTRKHLFDAKILDSHGCPERFYREVAWQLAQWWDR